MIKQYKCTLCGKTLTALNMSDNDDICQTCETPILDKLFMDIDKPTTLTLWDNNTKYCI